MSIDLEQNNTACEPEGYFPPGVYTHNGQCEIHARLLKTYSGEAPYLLVVREDGTGGVYDLSAGFTFQTINDGSWRKHIIPVDNYAQHEMGQFKHTEDVRSLSSMDDPHRSQRLNDLFWADWNEQILEPFISPADCEPGGDFSGEETFKFTKGSEEGMIEIIEMILMTDPDIRENVSVTLLSSDAAETIDEESTEITERSNGLILIAMNDFEFTGFEMSYTDEYDDQRCGYDRNPTTYSFEMDTIVHKYSNRDRLALKNKMAAWLTARGLQPEKYL